MSANHERDYKKPRMAAAALKAAIERVPEVLGRRLKEADFSSMQTSSDGFYEYASDRDLSDLPMVDVTLGTLNFYLRFESGPYVTIDIHNFDQEVLVRVSADTRAEVTSIFDLLERELSLEPAPPRPSWRDRLDDERRANARERELWRMQGAPVECFLSHRFEGPDAALAVGVERFLKAAGCNVSSGRAYEPRRLSDKVRDLITEDLDLIVVLIGPTGQSAWTRDEMTRAGSLNVPVVPLVERSQTFEPGLFGDTEYIPFDAEHVGDAYVGLLEAVKFVRERRNHELRQEDRAGS